MQFYDVVLDNFTQSLFCLLLTHNEEWQFDVIIFFLLIKLYKLNKILWYLACLWQSVRGDSQSNSSQIWPVRFSAFLTSLIYFFTLATGITHFCPDFHGKKGWKGGCIWKNFWVSIGCIHQDKTEKSGEYDSVYSIE